MLNVWTDWGKLLKFGMRIKFGKQGWYKEWVLKISTTSLRKVLIGTKVFFQVF